VLDNICPSLANYLDVTAPVAALVAAPVHVVGTGDWKRGKHEGKRPVEDDGDIYKSRKRITNLS
jgi:hypothetical protein